MDLATTKEREVARHSEFGWHGGYSGPIALARRRGAAVAAFARLCAVKLSHSALLIAGRIARPDHIVCFVVWFV